MGNVQQQFSNFVGNSSPLRLMNEDTFLVTLKNLNVRDYVNLTMLCRDFKKIFDSNNFLWAQMCEVFANTRHAETFEEEADDEPFLKPRARVATQASFENLTVARILLTAFNGQKLMNNGTPLLHKDTLNVRDKQLVSQFNFKDAIKKFYIHIIQRQALQLLCNRYVGDTTASLSIEVREYNGQFKKMWNPTGKKKLQRQCAQDYYYYVDFGCNPRSLFELQYRAVMTLLYDKLGGRMVVYQKSTVEPRRRPRFISRMPARRIDKIDNPRPLIKKK